MGIVSCETSGKRAPSVAHFPAVGRLLDGLAARFWPLYQPLVGTSDTSGGLVSATFDDAAVARRFIQRLPDSYIGSPEPRARELAAAVEHIEALLAVIDRTRADSVAASLAHAGPHSSNCARCAQ